MMKKLVSLFCFSFIFTTLYAQEIPLNLANRLNAVEYIFEGKVIHSEAYDAYNGKDIYTSNTVEITKILKGNIQCGTIEVITHGGDLGNESLEISHSLKLAEGSMGIFLCDDT